MGCGTIKMHHLGTSKANSINQNLTKGTNQILLVICSDSDHLPLQPKPKLPEDLKKQIRFTNADSFSVFHYSENETLCIPSLKDNSELEIETDLAFQFQWRRLKHRLLSAKQPANSSKDRPLLHWGSPDLEALLNTFSKMGINASVEQGAGSCGSKNTYIVHVHDPKKASIEIGTTGTVISAVDENLASLIFEAIDSVLDGI